MASSGEEGLYSRQLYVLGGGARRLAGAAALVSGLRGTGAQVAAALVLAGTGRVVLHDRGAACTADRAHQFLLGESDVGQNRAEASQRVLAELNPRVVVAAHTGELSEAFLTSFQVVVLTESPLEEQLRIGDFCHARGICFIVADAKGLAGQLFCDFGEHFVVDDPAEGDPACAAVQHISQGNPGVVTCVGAEDSRGHLFCNGDLVTFSGVEGMTELNGQEPVPVHVLDAFRLEIGDTSSFSPYHRGGLVSQVRLPQVHSYEPLRRALTEPQIQVASPEELPRSRSLHAAFQALHAFRAEQGRLPRPRAPADTERVLELAQSLGAQQGPLDEDVVRAFASVSAGDLCPVAAVVGALAAQEALKAITRKFLPLDQWLYFDALECLALEGAARLTEEDCAPRGSRYDGQIAVFGAAFQEQLGRQKYLVVGAGAIGCELLKNFAMMGLAAGPDGDLTVTDMDTVALSNLHRQFLYRSADISKPKSVVAAAAVRRMNPSVRVTAHQNQVGPATEPLYGDNFFRHLDGVTSALDTLEARECWRGERGRAPGRAPQLPSTPGSPQAPTWSAAASVTSHRCWTRARRGHGGTCWPWCPPSPSRWCRPAPLGTAPSPPARCGTFPAPSSTRCRTPTWITSWLLPTSLPKRTRCHHAATGRPPRPSSAAWSCRPLHPRRGSRSPSWRSRRGCRCLQDNNIHVDFITAASNLRAENYGIPAADWLTSKRIAGRIVPAIITTTAAVAGLACLEVYKLVWGCRDRSCYRNSNLWLSDCLLLRVQPLPPPTYRYGGREWSCWDRLEMRAVGADGQEMTVQEVLDWLQRTHGWTVTMLLRGRIVLYDREEGEETQTRQRAQKLSENLEDAGERRQRELELHYVCEGEDAEAEDARPPLLCSLP
ncbi:ubiquitin-like modifier-activating enzyme 7 isoform X3 [Calonectris borealis]|uniref:ubiquitin-like modifier-activating enzyme 7 isoform X3 n=1 Tax=Calonectris borealis TaxID=1323832 RepID=UPI003F4B9454